MSGMLGTNALRLVAVEPRREQEMSSKRKTEVFVRILRRQWTATLDNAQVQVFSGTKYKMRKFIF